MTPPPSLPELPVAARQPHNEHVDVNRPSSSVLSTQLVSADLERWSSIASSDELANSIAHDLIQPLCDIVNNVWLCRELIGDSPVAADIHATLASIETQAMRTTEMIHTVRRLVNTWEGGAVPGNGDTTVS